MFMIGAEVTFPIGYEVNCAKVFRKIVVELESKLIIDKVLLSFRLNRSCVVIKFKVVAKLIGIPENIATEFLLIGRSCFSLVVLHK